MNRNDAKQTILKVVRENPGINAVKLIVCNELTAAVCSKEYALLDLINELVEEKSMIEVEYILQEMDYRVKSTYFPAETDICLPPEAPKDTIAFVLPNGKNDSILFPTGTTFRLVV